MGTRPNHVRKATRRARKPRPDLLEVWLEFLAKIEGPKRRRAAEFRRRRDNPRRRVSNRGFHLRAFGPPCMPTRGALCRGQDGSAPCEPSLGHFSNWDNDPSPSLKFNDLMALRHKLGQSETTSGTSREADRRVSGLDPQPREFEDEPFRQDSIY